MSKFGALRILWSFSFLGGRVKAFSPLNSSSGRGFPFISAISLNTYRASAYFFLVTRKCGVSLKNLVERSSHKNYEKKKSGGNQLNRLQRNKIYHQSDNWTLNQNYTQVLSIFHVKVITLFIKGDKHGSWTNLSYLQNLKSTAEKTRVESRPAAASSSPVCSRLEAPTSNVQLARTTF